VSVSREVRRGGGGDGQRFDRIERWIRVLMLDLKRWRGVRVSMRGRRGREEEMEETYFVSGSFE